MRIAYFVPELGDAAVGRRVRMFETGGASVSVFGFTRARSPEPAVKGARPLGETANGRLAERVFSVLGALPRLLADRSWARADLIVARNLEMLALVRMAAPFGGRARIAYECLDIHRVMLGRGPAARLLRAIERILLRGVDSVLTSSPSFEDNYFRRIQGYGGDLLLVENKVVPANFEDVSAPALAAPAGPPWRIGWFGVLRCRRTLDLLAEAARRSDGRIEVHIRGRPALDQIPDFHEVVSSTPGMRFDGAYRNPEDLQAIYSGVHFVWAVDFFEAGMNSDWLLPCRLYEGGANGAVPIATGDVAISAWLKQHRVGVVLEEPVVDSLLQFADSLAPEAYEELRQAVASKPRATFVVDQASCGRMVEWLEAGAGARPARLAA